MSVLVWSRREALKQVKAEDRSQQKNAKEQSGQRRRRLHSDIFYVLVFFPCSPGACLEALTKYTTQDTGFLTPGPRWRLICQNHGVGDAVICSDTVMKWYAVIHKSVFTIMAPGAEGYRALAKVWRVTRQRQRESDSAPAHDVENIKSASQENINVHPRPPVGDAALHPLLSKWCVTAHMESSLN